MSYMKADDVLSKQLVTEIQKYVDGQMLYIPRRKDKVLSWGQKSGAKENLEKRNSQIFMEYRAGRNLSELSDKYCLSEKRIQRIIYEYDSSKESDVSKGGTQVESRK